MAVFCSFFDVIVPISKIDEVYPGGFARFKEQNKEFFPGVYWHDDYLFREGAMNLEDAYNILDKWENLGLQLTIEIDGELHYKDFCPVDGMFGIARPCKWLKFHMGGNYVYMVGKPIGAVIGPGDSVRDPNDIPNGPLRME